MVRSRAMATVQRTSGSVSEEANKGVQSHDDDDDDEDAAEEEPGA